jgi:hypothetical protein
MSGAGPMRAVAWRSTSLATAGQASRSAPAPPMASFTSVGVAPGQNSDAKKRAREGNAAPDAVAPLAVSDPASSGALNERNTAGSGCAGLPDGLPRR